MPILLDEQWKYPLPKMHKVCQIFQRPRLDDIKAHIDCEIMKDEILTKIRPGTKVAIAVGSRGIRNIEIIVKEVVKKIKSLGADPFIVSAMGSHGGGTSEGQRIVLASYGITEENMGVKILTSMDVTYLGKTSRGINVFFDSVALGADLIVPINRVKLHTDFVADIQSGLCKMLVIGLGNHIGCTAIHEADFDIFADTLLEAVKIIMNRAHVGFGVAVLENAYDETAMIEAIPSEKLITREKELVQIAKTYMPMLMIPDIDVLVVDEIGKNISGAGYDPNILGKSFILKKFVLPVPHIKRMVLFDVTDQSHGNAAGMGNFDVITRKVFDKLDLPQIYANGVAIKSPEGSKIPIIAESEEEAIRIAIQVARGVDKDRLKIVRIKNTLELNTIEVSDALLDYVASNKKLKLI